MEHVRHKMILVEAHSDNKQSGFTYDTAIYHAMCVKQDFTNGTNADFYNLEELALEVV